MHIRQTLAHDHTGSPSGAQKNAASPLQLCQLQAHARVDDGLSNPATVTWAWARCLRFHYQKVGVSADIGDQQHRSPDRHRHRSLTVGCRR